MSTPSLIDTLPPQVRQRLIRRIIGSGYARYEEIAAWLSEMGYRTSKSALHRFGQELKARREEIVESDLSEVKRSPAVAAELRMRCIEAAVAAHEPDVLKAAQTYFEWLNLPAEFVSSHES